MSSELRAQILSLWNGGQGKTATEIAAALGARWATVWAVIRAERDAGNRLAAPRKRQPPARITVHVASDVYAKLKEVVDGIKDDDLPDWTINDQAGLILEIVMTSEGMLDRVYTWAAA